MPPQPPSSLRITDIIGKFKPSKAFNNTSANAEITCLDFDDQGEFCIASSSDETLQLYDCKQGKFHKTLFSKKYGVHLAKFTHSNSQVVYASTKEDDTLRYLSLHDNSYIRYFRGHKDKVNCLEISPVDEQFISCSRDNTVRIWDLKSSQPQGLLHLPSPSLAAFDPSGIIFAVASQGTIYLYDLRNYDKAPFVSFPVKDDAFLQTFGYPPIMPDWTKLEFSNDGKKILVGTKGNAHYLLDAFTGEMQLRLQRQSPTKPRKETSGDVCFSPDGRYVLGGNGQKNVCVWDSQQRPQEAHGKIGSLWPVNTLEYSKDMAGTIAFNPRHAMLATASKEVVFWLPNLTPPSPPGSPGHR